VRMIKPAPMSSTIASATSATTRPAAARRTPTLELVRPDPTRTLAALSSRTGEHRHETECQRRQDSECERKQENEAVDVNIIEPRAPLRSEGRAQRVHAIPSTRTRRRQLRRRPPTLDSPRGAVRPTGDAPRPMPCEPPSHAGARSIEREAGSRRLRRR
jgi:hypothetical protein